MNKLKNEIATYINSWEECNRCKDMYKFSRLTCYNDDTLVCDKCGQEDM